MSRPVCYTGTPSAKPRSRPGCVCKLPLVSDLRKNITTVTAANVAAALPSSFLAMNEPVQPRVTALIVSRNNAAALRSTLESLELSEGRERLEILVVDDGSQDDTDQILAGFPDVISLRVPKRIGWTRAVNIALRTAKGEYIFLLQPGVQVQPATVHGLADRFDSRPDAGAVCPAAERTWRIPSVEDLRAAWRNGSTLQGGNAGEAECDYPQGSPVLVRRELLRAMNYLDARFGDRWSDLEMFSRIRNGHKRVVMALDLPVSRVPSREHLDDVDSAHGIATWLAIHHGFAAGLKFRLGTALSLAGSGRVGDAFKLLSGYKIDGNQ